MPLRPAGLHPHPDLPDKGRYCGSLGSENLPSPSMGGAGGGVLPPQGGKGLLPTLVSPDLPRRGGAEAVEGPTIVPFSTLMVCSCIGKMVRLCFLRLRPASLGLTTTATNAVLEGKTARTGMPSTRGFHDILKLAWRRAIDPHARCRRLWPCRTARPTTGRARRTRSAYL
jgi:hydantoinase/oxoprolinase-like protein